MSCKGDATLKLNFSLSKSKENVRSAVLRLFALRDISWFSLNTLQVNHGREVVFKY